MVKLLFTIVTLVLLAQPCFAVPQVLSSVDQTNVAIDETLTLMVTVTELDVQGLDFPRDTNDYTVVATSSSSNFSYINGKSTSSKTFKFLIRAKHLGSIELPAASINSGANVYNTQPIIITVVPAASNPISAPLNSATATPNSRIPQNVNTRPQKIFAKISVGKSNPYINEQIPLSLKIYHKGNLRSLNIPSLNLDNFISEKYDKAKEYQVTEGIEDYLVYEIDFLLFPVKAGLLTIPSNKITAIILEDNNNLSMGNFDPFRMMNPFLVEKEIPLETNALQLNVKSLPKGAPLGFSGYVGELAVSHSLKQNSVTAGDAVTIQTKIYGSGDLSNIDTNLVQESKLYSIFKDKEKRREEINNSIKYSEVLINTAVIPNKTTGKLAIETKSVISFNPKTGKYESHGGQKFEVDVLAASDDEAPTETPNKEVPSIEIKEIFVIPDAEIKSYKSLTFDTRIILALLIILNLLMLLIKIYRQMLKLDLSQGTTKGALIKTSLKTISKSEDIAEISKLLKELRNNLEADLEQSPELKQKLDAYLKESDVANYAMQSSDAMPASKLEYFRTNAVSIIKELEKRG